VYRLRVTLTVEDHERLVVVEIQQGADVSLKTMQLRIGQDLRWVEPGFPEHAGQEEREACRATVVAAVNVEDFLRDGGQGS
jgi:hypothetical protein